MPPARRGQLDAHAIRRAALALIDADGLDAFSMRKLGARLGVEAMSIYHHVSDKSAVLDGVAAEVFTELEVPIGPLGRWQDEMAALMGELRRVYLLHPNVLPILGTRPPSGPEMAPIIERALATFAAAGLPDSQSIYLLNVCGVFTLGHCLSEVGPQPLGAAEPAVVTDPHARAVAFASAPTVAAAYAATVDTFGFDAQFALGVDLLIAGLATHVSKSTNHPEGTTP